MNQWYIYVHLVFIQLIRTLLHDIIYVRMGGDEENYWNHSYSFHLFIYKLCFIQSVGKKGESNKYFETYYS